MITDFSFSPQGGGIIILDRIFLEVFGGLFVHDRAWLKVELSYCVYSDPSLHQAFKSTRHEN